MKPDSAHIRADDDASDAARDEVREHRALKWHGGKTSERDEKLAVEEPLEIRLAGRRFTLTMRTPAMTRNSRPDFSSPRVL